MYFNPLTEDFQLESPNIRNRPDWFNVTQVINEPITKIVDRKKLKKELSLSEEKIYYVIAQLERLKSQLTKEHLPVYRIPSEIDYDKIAEIFVLVNSKGTRIRITELLLALLATKLPGEFKNDFNNFYNELSEKEWELDVSVFMRSLLGIIAGHGRLSTFRQIAKDLSQKELKKKWKATKEHLNHIVKILEENLGIRSSTILPSQNVLVPLVTYLHQNGGKLTNKQTKKMVLWFLLASFWGRYSGSAESKLDEDMRAIGKTRSLDEPLDNLEGQTGRLKVDEDSFAGRGDDKRLLLYVISREFGATDWFKGHKITTTDFEEHHIFPRSLLKKEGIETSLIDDIANIAFLTEKANRKISNSRPIEYLPKIDPEKLRNQFIPLDKKLWKMDAYEEFLRARRKLIVKHVNKFLDSVGL